MKLKTASKEESIKAYNKLGHYSKLIGYIILVTLISNIVCSLTNSFVASFIIFAIALGIYVKIKERNKIDFILFTILGPVIIYLISFGYIYIIKKVPSVIMYNIVMILLFDIAFGITGLVLQFFKKAVKIRKYAAEISILTFLIGVLAFGKVDMRAPSEYMGNPFEIALEKVTNSKFKDTKFNNKDWDNFIDVYGSKNWYSMPVKFEDIATNSELKSDRITIRYRWEDSTVEYKYNIRFEVADRDDVDADDDSAFRYLYTYSYNGDIEKLKE